MGDKDRDLSEEEQRLQQVLEKIERSLGVNALMQLANEFYTKEERTALYAQHKALEAEDQRTLAALIAPRPQEELGWEQLVAKYGEAGATAQTEERESLRLVRVAAGDRLKAFEKEHKLLLRLREAKAEFSKGRFDN